MYCRVLNIYAYDNIRTSDATMLWKTNLASCWNSSDMRYVLPYMAYVAWGNMGQSTGGNKEYTTFLDDIISNVGNKAFYSIVTSLVFLNMLQQM
jgi:hypothetical protein